MRKAERLNQELIFLRDKKQFQLADLMAEFAIAKRTALRDVAALEDLGLAVYAEHGRGGCYHVQHQKLLTPVFFDNHEIQAVFFALKAVSQLSATPFTTSYTRIIDKLMATMTPPMQATLGETLQAVSYYNVAPVTQQRHLKMILSAILAKRQLVVTWQQGSASQLEVNQLFYRNGIWFFSAYDAANHQFMTYRCDAVISCHVLHDKASRTLAELNRLQSAYDHKFHDIPFFCRLTALGKEIFLKKSYPNMRLVTVDGTNHINGAYNQSETDYMVQYLLAFGTEMRIDYPPDLKSAFLAKLSEMMGDYH